MFMYWFTNYNTPEMTNHMLKGSLLNGKGRGTGDWLDLVGAGFPPLKYMYISIYIVPNEDETEKE